MNPQFKSIPRSRGFPVDWFTVGLVVAALVAWISPEPGARGGWMQPELVTRLGVGIVFFFHGLRLSFDTLKAGTFRWPLHLTVQLATFAVFPLLGLAIYTGLAGSVGADVRLGLFFLCVLPSTVSSAVALTAVAGGNVAGALFNATLSMLLGVVLTPLWVALVARTSAEAPSIAPVTLDLIQLLVLPLVAGQLLRRWLAAWAGRWHHVLAGLDRMLILLLVYTSFCDSFQQGAWTGHGWRLLLLIGGLSAGLLAASAGLMVAMGRVLGLPREDQIAAMFCGSQKSLASGVPMAKLLFGAHPAAGVILLPIMIYHSMQLIAGAWIARRWSEGNRP